MEWKCLCLGELEELVYRWLEADLFKHRAVMPAVKLWTCRRLNILLMHTCLLGPQSNDTSNQEHLLKLTGTPINENQPNATQNIEVIYL